MKIVQNTLKIEEKFSDVQKNFRVGPKKVGSVGFPETRLFFFGLNRNPCIGNANTVDPETRHHILQLLIWACS